jgi:hypothetical protein
VEVVPSAYDLIVLRKLAGPHALLLSSREIGEMNGEVALFKQGFGLDFFEFDLDELMVDGEVSEVRDGLQGFFVAAFLYEPAGGEW